MPCWFYEPEDLKNTPSMKDGIDEGTEARYRREGARFIIEAGTAMKLRYDTMATGVVYFHRFYMFHSFKEFPRYLTGAACLFLAGKVEETPKKCKDIIRIAKELLPEHHFAPFGDDPKEEIMTYERILLQTIKFDLQVEHPYSYLLKYAKTFKGDKEKIQKLVQMAWTFVNDSLCTTLCLQWEPHITAVAFLYLAGRLSKSDLLDWSGKASKNKWWESLSEDVSLDIMEDVCHHLLDLYAAGKKGAQGGQSKGTKRTKQKSPLMSDPEKSKDEPRVKQVKSEGEKPTPPPPPPPPSKAKASLSSSSMQKQPVQQQQMPVTSAPAYQNNFPQATNINQPSSSGTSSNSNQSSSMPPSHQGTYGSSLPLQPQTFTPFTSVAPPVFTAAPTPSSYTPSTQSSFFSQAPPPSQQQQQQQQPQQSQHQQPLQQQQQQAPPSEPTQPSGFSQNLYTSQSQGAPSVPNVPVPGSSAPSSAHQFHQPSFSNQFSGSSSSQNYSIPPPSVPSVGSQPPMQPGIQGVGANPAFEPNSRPSVQPPVRPILNQGVSNSQQSRPQMTGMQHPMVPTQQRPLLMTPTPPMQQQQQPSLPPLMHPSASQSTPTAGNTGYSNRAGAASRNFGGFPSLGSSNPPPLMSLPVNPPVNHSNPTALATVRITGRPRHQQPGSTGVNWNR